jgi:hypothetical protein
MAPSPIHALSFSLQDMLSLRSLPVGDCLTTTCRLSTNSCYHKPSLTTHWLSLAVNYYSLLNCCWPCPARWFLIPSHTGLITIFYSLTAPGAFGPSTADGKSLCSLGTDRTQNVVSNSSSIVSSWVRSRGNLFIEPLPRNGLCNHVAVYWNVCETNGSGTI